MLCLAIETSCDDTSIAILQYTPSDSFNGLVSNIQVISSVTSSQIAIHAQYGGVIPEIGARYHTTNFIPVLNTVLLEAAKNLDISIEGMVKLFSFIAVTNEPGLASALKVGIEEAKAIQYYFQIKYQHEVELKMVNHLHGHLASVFINSGISHEPIFPHLHLLVSGGNTQILSVDSWGNSKIVGKTIDDAVGECYDKVARMLGLKYPGGVSLAKIAGLEDHNILKLNRAMLNNNVETSLNTSFSGLKTQARYIIQSSQHLGVKYEELLSDVEIKYLIETKLEDISDPRLLFIKSMCISIQSICTEQLIRKLKLALLQNEYQSIGLSGGVSANLLLRQKVSDLTKLDIFKPELKYTGDNAAMIGMCGILNEFVIKLS
jgi:N6-L-threonylcarbamoyladenine synthase